MPKVSINSPTPAGKSPFQCFREKWKNGCGSSLCQGAGTRVVLSRGSVPADVVFIGEAPGHSENVLASPFKGPAGKKLDWIIRQALPAGVTYAITNLVGCIPLGEDGRKTSEPFPEEIKRCRPRLVEFVRLCRPRMLVLVGDIARRYVPGQSLFDPVNWLPPGQEYLAIVAIEHPASVLRKVVVHQGVLFQRCATAVRDAWEGLTDA